jgi:hypothetical protein
MPNQINAYYLNLFILVTLAAYEKKWRVEPTDIPIYARTRFLQIPERCKTHRHTT